MEEDKVDFGYKRVRRSEKPRLVNHVFSGVAGNYDVMNDVMSFGIHRFWKDLMIDWLAPKAGQNLLDVAGGTGDIAMRFVDRCKGDASATIVDFTNQMISYGRDRSYDYVFKSKISWVCADAMHLPLLDSSFDIYTISFGLRNVTDIETALMEAYRVLKPGGRVMILEFSTPKNDIFKRFYDRYSFDVIPLLGKLIANDKKSYQYLVESIRKFPKQDALVNILKSVGFREVKYRNLSMGIVALHSGWKI